MADHESPLHGGNISQVVRVGSTVRRHQGPWSVTVHGLLQHLEAHGFAGAPRFLGIDDQDREILSFMPGEVGNYPLQPSMWSDTALIEAGRLLRRMHDATVGYAPPDAPWQQIAPESSQHEVICHNDVAPYNTVFVDGEPRAFIDFDTAGPGPRIWDVAYAAYTFVPLAQFVPLADGTTIPYEAVRHAENRRRRLRLLSDSYGLERAGDLMLVVERRLHALCETLDTRAADGDAVYQRLIDEGHLAHYQAEIAFIRQHGPSWEIRSDG